MDTAPKALDRTVTWLEICDRVPELRALRQDVLRYRKYKGEIFCANAVWYGSRAGYVGHPGVRPRVVRLVGSLSESLDPVVRSGEAYDVAYHTLYDLLPDCRGNCACTFGVNVTEVEMFPLAKAVFFE